MQANDRRTPEFPYQNLMIEAELTHGAHCTGVQRLMFPNAQSKKTIC